MEMSKKQAAIALSSSEAELYAGSMVCQDGLFIDTIVKELLPDEVSSPMYVHVDNSGAVFIMSNDNVSDRTKHIDIRHRWISSLFHTGSMWDKCQRSTTAVIS